MSPDGKPFDCPPLAILSRAGDVAQLALRRVLRAKSRNQPLVVIDYQGAAAAALNRAHTSNLDPFAGIMHGTERDQGSLIFDLIEEFRAPFGDRLILGMLGRGFRPQLGRHGDLRASVRRLIVNAFHRMWGRPIRWRGKMHAPVRILELQARDLAKAFLGEETYRPFQFRW